MSASFNSFSHTPAEVHNGLRAVRPEEIAEDCQEARAALAKINERAFDGERVFSVSPGHAGWLAEQFREAGWLVDENGIKPGATSTLRISKDPAAKSGGPA